MFCAAAEEGAATKALVSCISSQISSPGFGVGTFCLCRRSTACVVVQLFVCVAVQLFVCVVKLFVLIVQEISNPEFVGEFLFC